MAAPEVEIRRAAPADLDSIVPLFDAYRQFYRQPSDPDGARAFLLARLDRSESVIFLASKSGRPAGFTQLYPSFSSGAMAAVFILNDLFVSPEARGRGIGSALLQEAALYSHRAGAIRMALSTELSNSTAQSLYEKLGWKRDTVFCTYQLTL